MIDKIRTYIAKNNLICAGDVIIVGLSGGADSVALLHVLMQLNVSCIAAHCNFHLRGDESNQDEAFARQITMESLHIPYYSKDFDTIGYAKQQHISVEMAARELRYEWFETLRVDNNAQAIAVAHHRDDNTETILLNLIRGTGLRGLSGMRPKREFIIRPFLETSQQEILDWLHKQNITFRTDSSNLSDEYTRNYIRLHLLPMMERLNPSVREAIARTADHLSDVEAVYADYIKQQHKRLIDKLQRIRISVLMQTIAPQTVLYELLKPFGFTRILSESIYESLSGISGKVFYAPASGYQIVKDRDFLLLTAAQTKNETVYTIDAHDSIEIPIRLNTRKLEITNDYQINRSNDVALFDCDKLTFPLTVRTWRKGDWFVPFGMKGRKKLSDYFSDKKFDLNRKKQTWLLCNNSDIIWIIGERVDDRYKIDKSTKSMLAVHFFA